MQYQPTVLGIVSYKVFPAQMGGQKYIVDYYTELAKHTKVVLAVSKDNLEPHINGCTIYPFLYNHWYFLLNIIYCFKLSKLIRKENIDVIMIDHSYFGGLGILLRWMTKKKLVIKSANIESLRFKDMRRWGWWLYDVYEQWVHLKADRCFFITREERERAIARWQLNPTITYTLPFGTLIQSPATAEEKLKCRTKILKDHQLPENTKLFFFNGTLNYLPNQDALYIIVNELLYRMEAAGINFRIIICGSRIKNEWREVLQASNNIIFKGFVTDISFYNKGTDCFICPVTLGTGIKTKLVEALAWGQPVIACAKCGEGLTDQPLNNLLVLTEDYNWKAFAAAMIALNPYEPLVTNDAFYAHFNWTTIVKQSILTLPR